eukprot:Pgem_evm1s10126
MVSLKEICNKVWKRLRKTSMIVYTILAAILGVGIGLAFSASDVDPLLAFWFGMPGKLFIRALTLVVVPLVFCSVVLGVVGVSEVGGSVGKLALWTCALYALTTTVGVLEGLAFVQSFRFAWENNWNTNDIYTSPKKVVWDAMDRVSIINENYFSDANLYFNSTTAAKVAMKFSSEATSTNFTQLFYNSPHTISFIIPTLVNIGDVTEIRVFDTKDAIIFSVPDGSLTVKSSDTTEAATSAGQSVSDSISNLLFMLVPRNALGTFVGNAENSANLLGMIMFAIGFGVCLTILKRKNKLTGDHLTESLKQVLDVITYFTDKLMYLTPFAVFSLITEAFGKQSLDELSDSMKSLGGLLFLFTRQWFFKHYAKVSPALNVAFASASSASTLPTTMECAKGLGMSEPVSKFALSLGATINMDGNAIFQPAIMMWLANSAGIEVSIADQIIICVVAALASMGSSPAPGLTPAVILVWQACFPSHPVPEAIAYVLALDWLLDRCITSLNVAGDTVVARIVDSRNRKELNNLDNIESDMGTIEKLNENNDDSKNEEIVSESSDIIAITES